MLFSPRYDGTVTLSITTFSIMGSFSTLSITISSAIMLSVVVFIDIAEGRGAATIIVYTCRSNGSTSIDRKALGRQAFLLQRL
jgi:hypothetical protein